MKNYNEFSRILKVFEVMSKDGKVMHEGSENSETFVQKSRFMLSNAKIFEVDDDIKKMLLMTKIPDYNVKLRLPFPNTFIDVEFDRQDIDEFVDEGKDMKIAKGIGKVGINSLHGIVVADNILFDKNETQIGKATAFMSLVKSEESIWFFDFNENIQMKDREILYSKENGELVRMLYHFTVAFLNFLNDPEVQLVSVDYDDKRNEKRLRRGKPVVQTRICIKLTGKLKIYVDKIRSSGIFEPNHFSYKFWVRGHFRTLRSESRYGDKVGTKVWIPPYLKGQGVLIDKRYLVERREEMILNG